MTSFLYWILSLVCLLAAAAAPAGAQELAGCKTQSNTQWTIEQVSRDHLRLLGAVEVICDEDRFFADEIELFTAEDRLVATGNVVFTSGSNNIAAERLEFDTRTKTGTFYNATGTAALQGDGSAPAQDRSMYGTQEPAVYFYGETLEKIGPKRYRVSRGGFTTCVQPVPRWELTSGTVTLNLDQYALLTNTFFKVKGVPVLYLPVFYYPINEEDRATGFLIPAYGASTIRGHSLSNAFFWAINRSQDATFMHDWFSKTGQGFGGEYRYLLGAGSEGFMRLYGLREQEATYDDGAGQPFTSPERRSYEVRGQASHRISQQLRARARADYFSSMEVKQTYYMNVYDASQRQRSFSGSLTGNFGAYTVIGSVDRHEYFYGTTSSSTRGGAPRALVSRAERPLFGSPAYFSVNGEYNRMIVLRKDEVVVDQGLTRLDVFPRVRFPFTRWQFLTINSTAGLRSTYWTESRDPAQQQIEQGLTRNYYELQSNVTGPVLNRIWTFAGSRYAEKLKHSIQPYFNVQRISAIDEFDRIVQVDSTDTIVGNTTRLSYGVMNRIYRKPAGDRSREILNVSVGQSYYSDARAALYDIYYRSVGGSAPSRFSPLSLAVRGIPTDYITANLRAEYDTQFNAFRSITADGTIDWRGWLQAAGGWSQRRFIPGLPGFDDPSRLDHYLNGTTNVRLKQNRFGGGYQFNYDVLRSSFLQQRLTAYYNAQCCGFAVEYQTYDLSRLGYSPVAKDRRFNFSFSLAGIGTFANIFGALGGGGMQGY